ncbi:MAG: type IV secretory system conjugative DNA transfer family protein [Ruminococcus sp.]|nr:type IV secretory system conjugative DNA transfer family protein [Ruminococcus sp.]
MNKMNDTDSRYRNSAAAGTKEVTAAYRVIGKNTYFNTDGFKTRMNSNVSVFGSPGCGKTSGFVSPNIATAANHSIVVSDTKGQLFRKHRESLMARGYTVHCLDMINFERSTCGYDPLRQIRKKTDRQGNVKYNETDIMTVANYLCPALKSNDPFWELSAQNMLCCIIDFVLSNLDEDEKNLASVTDLLRMCIPEDGRISFLEDYAYKAPESLTARCYGTMKTGFEASKTFSSTHSIASNSIAAYDNSELRDFMRKPQTMAFEDLGKRKIALFLQNSDIDHSRDSMISLAVAQMILCLTNEADKRSSGQLRVPVDFYLDDFGASCYLPEFPRWIAVLRSRLISVTVLCQSMTQLETRYSAAECGTILSCTDHILYMGGCSDPATLHLLADRAGMLPETLASMPIDKMLIITRGEKARIVDKIEPDSVTFENSPSIDELSRCEAQSSSINITLERSE